MKSGNPYRSTKIVVPAAMLFFMLFYLGAALQMGFSGKGAIFIGEKTGEAFFPLILGILGVPIAIKMLFDAVSEVRKSQENGEEQTHTAAKTPLILSGISFLYIVAFYYIGLIPALLGYVFFFMMFFDDKIQHLLRKFIYSVIISGLVFVLYKIIFNVQFDKLFFVAS